MSEAGEKRFDPTEHRREQFRKEGRYARSRDAGARSDGRCHRRAARLAGGHRRRDGADVSFHPRPSGRGLPGRGGRRDPRRHAGSDDPRRADDRRRRRRSHRRRPCSGRLLPQPRRGRLQTGAPRPDRASAATLLSEEGRDRDRAEHAQGRSGRVRGLPRFGRRARRGPGSGTHVGRRVGRAHRERRASRGARGRRRSGRDIARRLRPEPLLARAGDEDDPSGADRGDASAGRRPQDQGAG